MFKATTRIASSAPLSRALPKAQATRRFLSTAPPHQKSRSWRSSATRWGLAGALVYYYNTASAFAEEPNYPVRAPPETSPESEIYQTVASISEERKAQARSKEGKPFDQSQSVAVGTVADEETTAPGSPQALEEEASEQGAFNEETGEINWDCPCLGGMAYGPCGEQFRAAFSCFVFSQEEPKGVDCIEHFKTMQNCFREHPEIYGSELDDDEEGNAEVIEGEPAAEPTEPPNQSNLASIQSTSENESRVTHPTSNAPASDTPTKTYVNATNELTKKETDSDEHIPRA